MSKDEALNLALEALETLMIERGSIYDKAITTIKEALAQPEHGWTPERIAGIARLKEAQDKRLAQPAVTESHKQEPVAWRYKILDYFGRPVWTLKTPKTDIRVFESQPLYTTPPPVAEPHKRPSRSDIKPLMDEEVNKLVDDEDWYNDPHGFVRAIEAAHGIKGEA